jgi:hypothetical protein
MEARLFAGVSFLFLSSVIVGLGAAAHSSSECHVGGQRSSFFEWGGWLFVVPAAFALGGAAYFLFSTLTARRWITVTCAAAAIVVGGFAVFVLLVLEDVSPCFA